MGLRPPVPCPLPSKENVKRKPKVGDAGELRFQVDATNVIDFAGGGMPAVLSTPSLIYYLENAGKNALAPLLEAGEACVGVTVDVRHLAATPLGQQVVCTARVLLVEDRTVTFQVEARDEQELIARGIHKRGIIDIERFAKRVAKKAARKTS